MGQILVDDDNVSTRSAQVDQMMEAELLVEENQSSRDWIFKMCRLALATRETVSSDDPLWKSKHPIDRYTNGASRNLEIVAIRWSQPSCNRQSQDIEPGTNASQHFCTPAVANLLHFTRTMCHRNRFSVDINCGGEIAVRPRSLANPRCYCRRGRFECDRLERGRLRVSFMRGRPPELGLNSFQI